MTITWDTLKPLLYQIAVIVLSALLGVGGTLGTQKLTAPAPQAPVVAAAQPPVVPLIPPPVPLATTSAQPTAPTTDSVCVQEVRALRAVLEARPHRLARPVAPKT